jgi:cobalamin biosynthesis protein CobW
MQSKIPATVITGFLGAGKTTVIRNLLMNAEGRRIALIINEFGDLGVDGDVLKGCGAETCSEDDIVELTNGCICCTVADDFIPTMEKLLERDNRPDHIVIETSGLALPQPLVAAFNWPGIKERVTVDGVVTVVDSAAVAAGRFADDHERVDAQRAADESLDHESPLEELFEDQLTAADLIVLNKTDLIDAAGLQAVRDEVSSRTARKPGMIEAREGRGAGLRAARPRGRHGKRYRQPQIPS